MMRFWMIHFFERLLFQPAYRRREKAEGLRDAADELRKTAHGLDTPWRVASFMETALREGPTLRLFDVPDPPEVTLKRGTGNAGDYARLAQALLALNASEALFVTVYERETGAPQMVCAVREMDGEGWYHISNVGMFGVYDGLELLAGDVCRNWRLAVARDEDMRIVTWLTRRERRRQA